MSSLSFVFLVVITVATSVSAVLHVLGHRYASLEKAAEDVDSVVAELPKADPAAK